MPVTASVVLPVMPVVVTVPVPVLFSVTVPVGLVTVVLLPPLVVTVLPAGGAVTAASPFGVVVMTVVEPSGLVMTGGGGGGRWGCLINIGNSYRDGLHVSATLAVAGSDINDISVVGVAVRGRLKVGGRYKSQRTGRRVDAEPGLVRTACETKGRCLTDIGIGCRHGCYRRGVLGCADCRCHTATDLADYLVKKGLPFRDAHEIVAHAVKAATSHQVDLSELPLSVLQEFNPQIGKDVYECLSLRGSLHARNTLGGTAPAQVRAQLERHKARLLSIS